MEFDDAAAAAASLGLPVREVLARAEAAAQLRRAHADRAAELARDVRPVDAAYRSVLLDWFGQN